MPLIDFVSTASHVVQTNRTLRDFLKVRVDKAFLQNLDTGETAEFLINPAELDEAYEAKYRRHGSLGLSHERLQFVGNTNVRFNLQVLYDQLVFDGRTQRTVAGQVTEVGRSSRHSDTPNEADKWRRFIQSLLYPRKAQKLPSASPPPVLFFWPNWISMRVRLMKASFRHQLFMSGTPRPRIYTATLVIEEEPMDRIFSEDIQRTGTNRPWAASSGPRRR